MSTRLRNLIRLALSCLTIALGTILLILSLIGHHYGQAIVSGALIGVGVLLAMEALYRYSELRAVAENEPCRAWCCFIARERASVVFPGQFDSRRP